MNFWKIGSLCAASVLALCARAEAQVSSPSRVGGSLATRGDGSIVAVVRAPDNSIAFGERSGFGGAGWSRWDIWNYLAGASTSPPVVITPSNSKLLVLIRSTDNKLYTRQETAAGSRSFGAWVQVPHLNSSGQTLAAFSGRPAMVRRSDGRVALYATDINGQLWEALQSSSTSSSWNRWQALSSPTGIKLRNSPVVAMMNSGAFVAFSAGSNNHLYCRVQANGTWGAWTDLGGALAGGDVIATGLNSNGRVAVFVNDSSSKVSLRTQTGVDANNWTAWATLPGSVTAQSRPAVANQADGRLSVFFYASGSSTLWWQSQTAPSGTSWSGWASVQSGATSPAAAITDSNGLIHAILLGNSGYVYERAQASAGSGSWSTLSSGYLGGPYAAP